ncbi:hypothetical protein BaRGS_00017176 [Batillaria attramentaria]|uniref:Uncharacterized protein n=1 Tax=Batillaria attramentaria TaxID=370345 RepID=A0ABD0KWC6_9CAEN
MDVALVTEGSVAHARQEYEAASQRIDAALHTLKSELMEMRQQDLQLLKQLIHISQSIQRLRRNQSLRATKSLSLSGHGLPLSATCDFWRRPPLTRQASVPQSLLLDKQRMLTATHSQSSTEADSLGSPDDFDFGSGSELDDSTSSLPTLRRVYPTTLYHPPSAHPPLSRARPLGFPHPLHQGSPTAPQPPTMFGRVTDSGDDLDDEDESSYDEILRRNVRLWKMSVSNRPDCWREEITCII